MVYAGDKSKMHSICSTPELAERKKFLRWVWKYVCINTRWDSANWCIRNRWEKWWLLVLLWLVITSSWSYFIITNFHTELKTSGKYQPWHEFSNIYTLYTTMGVERGGVEGVLGPSLLLKFSYYIFSNKGCLLSSEWKKWNFTIFAHPTKVLGFTWKILLLPPWHTTFD